MAYRKKTAEILGLISSHKWHDFEVICFSFEANIFLCLLSDKFHEIIYLHIINNILSHDY